MFFTLSPTVTAIRIDYSLNLIWKLKLKYEDKCLDKIII